MKGEDADLVVFNAEIHILNEGNKIVEAMAIKDGRIIEFGPDRQILNKYAYKSSIDARGKEIYPGFIDSHGHLLSYAELLLSADLVGSSSQKDMIERVVNYQDVNNKKIVIGRGWDQSLWDDSSFPDNQLLNESFKDTPVCLYRIDGHSAE